jgi:hypothetical protein
MPIVALDDRRSRGKPQRWGSRSTTIGNDDELVLKSGDQDTTLDGNNRETKITQGNDTLIIAEGGRNTTINSDDKLTIRYGNREVVPFRGSDTRTVAVGDINRTAPGEIQPCLKPGLGRAPAIFSEGTPDLSSVTSGHLTPRERLSVGRGSQRKQRRQRRACGRIGGSGSVWHCYEHGPLIVRSGRVSPWSMAPLAGLFIRRKEAVHGYPRVSRNLPAPCRA